MADPWSTVPELRLNLCVYILCMVGGIVGNITVIAIMLRWAVTYSWNNKHILFQAEVQQQEISLRYLENQPIPPLSISKYDYYFDPTVIIKFQASDLLLVTVAVPTQLLHYFSVQVTLVLYCTVLYCSVL